MKNCAKVVVAVAALCWAGQSAVASEAPRLAPEGRAWSRVAEGVWQKRDVDGALLTVARGAEGMKWALREMERELVKVSEHYRSEPTAERFELLARHLDAMAEMRRSGRPEGMENGAEEKAQSLPPRPPCNTNVIYTAAANAGPLNQGAWATASSQFSVIHNYSPYCNGIAYARAEAKVTSGGITTTQTQICSPPTDIIVNCSVSASVPGSGSCRSESFSYASYPPYSYYTSRSALNCGCGSLGPACAIEDVDQF